MLIELPYWASFAWLVTESVELLGNDAILHIIERTCNMVVLKGMDGPTYHHNMYRSYKVYIAAETAHETNNPFTVS
jgi:hypothetical protein